MLAFGLVKFVKQSKMASLTPITTSNCKEVGELKYFTSESEILGEGAFGCVYEGEFRGTAVAVKRIVSNDPGRKKVIETELGFVQFGEKTWHEHLARYLHKEVDGHFL